jgi:glycosyltransferase involved in cell wall biosynthesis
VTVLERYDSDRAIYLDVTRLVWRVWKGGLATGIDRVCQAYVEHFGARSRAVVQRSGVHFVLSPVHSDRLFKLLLSDRTQRLDLLRLAAVASFNALRTTPRPGAIYLNVGHTGLNERSLPTWIARHKLRAVYLIHDLIPLTHPQFCREGEADKHRRRMENVLASASGLIGNSRDSLDELSTFAAVQGRAMPASIAAWISGGDFSKQVQPRTASRPHFITVGTIEGRKNHQLLLDVWRKLVAEQGLDAPQLLIVGQRGWQAERVIEQLDDLAEVKDHVREIGTCQDQELAGWIAGARALLMPSFAEGFGMPVVEALALGTPVLASDLPVFREIAGDIPTYLSPHDDTAWVSQIRAFTGDNPERARQLERMASFRAPTWNEHFERVEHWLATL